MDMTSLGSTNGIMMKRWIGAALAMAALLAAPRAGATTSSGGPDPQIDAGVTTTSASGTGGSGGSGGEGGSGSESGSSGGCAVGANGADGALGAGLLAVALGIAARRRARRRVEG
ncbi:Hypothetical protein A7982_06539 [Minicystis rosea]|nr:Hypothetical protein A7982_06539 [Minicystis rosea]